MAQEHLDLLFNPQSVAVIGATDTPDTVGLALMTNLRSGGFPGRIVPVNPNRREVLGLECFPGIADAGTRIDLGIIAVPMAGVEAVIDQCAETGMRAAIILSAGGRETGESGKRIEERILALARKSGMRIIGPNCLGIICPQTRLNASFAPGMPGSGKVAVISQSGAVCTAILDMAQAENIGFSHFVSIGSMLDVDFGDLIDYLGGQANVESILLYVEHLTGLRKFMSAARAVSAIKPILVLKAGRSASGAKAAASHTGAMTGDDAVYDTAFKRAGIVRVGTTWELFDCAEQLAKQQRPRGTRMAIITNGGGPGVMAADTLARFGMEPTPLPAAMLEQLNAFLPPHWSRGNPMDILGDAGKERFVKTVAASLESRAFDGILVVMCPQALNDPSITADALIELLQDARNPVFFSWMGGKRMAEAVRRLNQAGQPTYETPERAVQAFLHLVAYHRNQELLRELPPRQTTLPAFDQAAAARIIRPGDRAIEGWLSEIDAKAILAFYGLPINPSRLATTRDEAMRIAGEFACPLAMKIVSPDILHKTEVGGVMLGVSGGEEAAAAYDRLMANAAALRPEAQLTGVSLQPHISESELELIFGSSTDPDFGPVLLFGLGGIFTEILADRALGLPPLNRLLARRMIEETRCFPLLTGYRNRPGADLAQIEEILVRMSQLVIDFPEIVELDMNPVMLRSGVPLITDARIRLAPTPVTAPHHLVISPYPGHLEHHLTTSGGVALFLRPVRPEDAGLLTDLFNLLSTSSIYFRFFGYLKSLSPYMLARMTQIDYDREISLVAIQEDDGAGAMLGIAHIFGDPDGRVGEIAVLVGDRWHGMGIGAALFLECLDIAREKGMETVWATVLGTNRCMLGLGKKAGFTLQPGDDASEYHLSINLRHWNRDSLAG